MSQIHFIDINPEFDRTAFLRQFDPKTSTYVVSDLHTKLDIQKLLFEQHDFLAEDAVLRASELWQRLLVRAHGDLQIVSQSLMQSIVSEWLDSKDIEWAGGGGAAQNLLTSLQQFLPIYLAPNGQTLFKEWLLNHENALMRMGQWFFLGLELWNFLLEKKIILVSWVPALLSQLPQLPEWRRHLIFDLEANLTGTESELIRRFTESSPSVSVLLPPLEWRQKYFKVMWPYRFLQDDGSAETLPWEEVSPAKTVRFTTRMAEGKNAVGQVRAWLDAGVSIEKIAVLAPDIEEYWPLISSYFEVEGIPVQKSKVAPLHSFIEISSWLARLRVESKSIDSADLELTMYNSRRRETMDFEKFRTLYKKIYDYDDLKRDQEILKLFQIEGNERSRFSRDAFVSWTLQRWRLEDPSENLQMILAQLLDETPISIEMTLRSWVGYLEAIAAKKEKTVAPSGGGVAFSKIESGFYQKWSHVYLMGLTESAVKGRESSMLTLSDIMQISNDLGFYLDYPDKPRIECMAHWIAANPKRETVLSFAATNFNGDPEAPSLFWLSRALASGFDIEKYTIPHLTRWDELQNVIEGSSAVNEDLGRALPEDIKLSAMPPLSASQIERFIQCPFKFTADKIFKLTDPAEVDLDLDHRTRGNLLHGLFEALLATPLNLNRTASEIGDILEELRLKEKVVFGDVRLWPSYKARFVALGEKFLDFERNWRKRFPSTKTIAQEFPFDVRLDGVQLRGRIDRIDEGAEGELVLIDYKSSGGSLTNHGSWMKNHQLQLALYSLIIESGLTDLGQRKVAGAFYYIAKDFTREKGMSVEGSSLSLLPVPGRGSKISEERKSELYNEVKSKLKEVAETIQAGRLHVRPEKPQDCPKCRWRKLCRAPHLN